LVTTIEADRALSIMRRLALATAGLIRWPRSAIRPVAIAALAAGLVATTLAAMTGPAPDGALTPQQADVIALFRSYGVASGLIGPSWWQAAVALSAVETYAQTTGDTTFDAAIARAFTLNGAGKFENNADDDTAWWGLVWLQAYELTGVPAYLSMARTDADYIHRDWDGVCGGGVWWQRDPRSYKNAIANELFLELAAWLHNDIRGDTKYLRWAEAEWSWFDRSGMINKDGLVNDGLDDNCQNNGQNTWTYNQGVILAGLAQLYRATGDQALLTSATGIARATIRRLTVAGVLTEPCRGDRCEDQLDADTQAFKGIFVSGLKVLAVTAKTTEFNGFFRRQARVIQDDDTTTQQQHGMFWRGPVARVTSASQASALEAEVASLDLP
jgi:hypothetical protein